MRVAVVIPCFRAGERVLKVIERVGRDIEWIFLVDDACPEKTGELVVARCTDPRVRVIFHAENQGVGGAMVTGYAAALETPADIVVKIDADGQMAPELIPALCRPIAKGVSDYSKGNRFHMSGSVDTMPALRLFGNVVLSFMTKLSSGYWQLFDPTNGFTAIHARVLAELNLSKLSKRYFFESDMLFRLNGLRAVVTEMPMKAVYDDEPSSLRPLQVIWPFVKGNLRNFFKRIVRRYFIADFSMASIELVLSIPLLMFGVIYGGYHWIENHGSAQAASAGVVMTAALPIILGVQLLLSWLNYDVTGQPAHALHLQLGEPEES